MSGTGVERLDRSACDALLGSESTGRVAVRHGGDLVIAPVRYAVVDGDAVVFRAPPGPLLDAAVMGTRMALEVDGTEPDGTPWCVLVSGYADEITDPRDQDRLGAGSLPTWSGWPCDHVVRIHRIRVVGERGACPVVDLAGAEHAEPSPVRHQTSERR